MSGVVRVSGCPRSRSLLLAGWLADGQQSNHIISSAQVILVAVHPSAWPWPTSGRQPPGSAQMLIVAGLHRRLVSKVPGPEEWVCAKPGEPGARICFD